MDQKVAPDRERLAADVADPETFPQSRAAPRSSFALEKALHRARQWTPDALAAMVLFPVQATYLLGYTALIYSGALAFGRPAGLFAMLITTLIAGLTTAITSSFRTACGSSTITPWRSWPRSPRP